jgi:hypothetical protein
MRLSMSTTAAGEVGQGVATIRQTRLPGFSTPEFGHEALGAGVVHGEHDRFQGRTFLTCHLMSANRA